MTDKRTKLDIEGHTVNITNPEKLMYPAAGFTKTHVIDYYVRVSPYVLPHVKDRPVTLKRYPDGVGGEFFYEKDAPGFTPSWVKTFSVPRRSGESDIRYIVVNNLRTLAWLANLANLELHPFLHRVPQIDRPTEIVFDLDPGEGASILDCAEVAFLLRETLERLELQSFAKASGSKGIQLYIPLNTPASYDMTQPFARALAELLASEHRDKIVSKMAKEQRRGKGLH